MATTSKESLMNYIEKYDQSDNMLSYGFTLYIPNFVGISLTKKYYDDEHTKYAVFTTTIRQGRYKRLSRICNVDNGTIKWTKSGKCLLDLFELNDKYDLSPIPED